LQPADQPISKGALGLGQARFFVPSGTPTFRRSRRVASGQRPVSHATSREAIHLPQWRRFRMEAAGKT
jgi:hypothetical protein